MTIKTYYEHGGLNQENNQLHRQIFQRLFEQPGDSERALVAHVVKTCGQGGENSLPGIPGIRASEISAKIPENLRYNPYGSTAEKLRANIYYKKTYNAALAKVVRGEIRALRRIGYIEPSGLLRRLIARPGIMSDIASLFPPEKPGQAKR